MSATKQEKSKALVLEAFDTLFNRRDYAPAERYWSPNHIQHSAHIEPGHEAIGGCIMQPDWRKADRSIGPLAKAQMRYLSRIQTQGRDTYQ
jgi:hypothetical protein